MNNPSGTRPFAPFEWLLSLRYLRARRQEGFISVNAVFSFLGIMLGVATLIIVMAVMNGFRKELLEKILGSQRPPPDTAAGISADRLEGSCRKGWQKWTASSSPRPLWKVRRLHPRLSAPPASSPAGFARPIS